MEKTEPTFAKYWRTLSVNDFTVKHCAAHLGIGADTYALKEDGISPFGDRQILALCAIFKDGEGRPLSVGEFFYGPGGKPPDREITQFFNKEGA